MATIGVVVPVYKVEQYLHRCVDSILTQSYSDFSLILVDDGSPDRCGEICEEYARKDSRIRVIHQKNQGQSVARNNAKLIEQDPVLAEDLAEQLPQVTVVCGNGTQHDLLMEEGEVQWLTFIDSDDWVHPNMLQCLLDAAQTFAVHIASCAFEETAGQNPDVPEQTLVSSLWSAKDYYLQHGTNATIACAKLYHRSCFTQMRYPPGRLHEDEFVTYRLLFAEKKLAVTFAPLYFYYINPEGITKKPWVSKRLDAWDAYEEQLTFFRQMGDPDLIRSKVRQYLENALRHYDAAEQAGAAKDLRRMRRRIRGLIRECWPIGKIAFWSDFDFLIRFYPILTRIYRLWLEMKH